MEEAGSQQLGKVCNHRSQMNEAKRLPSDAIHGEKEKKKIKEEKNTQNLLSSYTGAFIIHCDLPGMCWQTQSVLCDIVPVNWNDCTHSIVPNSRAPSSGGCTGCPATPGAVRAGLRGELCTVPLKAIQDLKKKTKTVFRAHIKTSRFLN